MNKKFPKKLSAFISALLLISFIPLCVNAQKKCPDGHCPKGQTCVNGRCAKIEPYCNCFVRPISFECGQLCGWRTMVISNYDPGSQSAAISFNLMQAEKIVVRIFDMTGRLVKILANRMFEQGEHKLHWEAAGVNAGIYIVQLSTGSYSETQKISLVE